MRPACVMDYRELAKRRLPRFLFEYIDGGSYNEVTLHNNTQDLANIRLRQRVLRDVDRIDTSTTLFGQAFSLPVALGPVGLSGLYARRGEVQAAQAAHVKGTQFCLSTLSACSIEEVHAGTHQPFWFQLYVMRDRSFMRSLLTQAEVAGCSALVFTVDLPTSGARYRDTRSGLSGAPGWRGKVIRGSQMLRCPGWLMDVGLQGRPHTFGNLRPLLGKDARLEDFFGWISDNIDASISWSDLEMVRQLWKGPLIIKGILDAEDARQAAALGVDGIIVSNHGGRQLDGASSTANALPFIVEAVGDRVTVLVDGGIRSGLDVLKMLALGAKGVLLGRAWAYGLAARKAAGVGEVLDIIHEELRVAMALTGCKKITEIDANILIKPSTKDRT